MQLTPLSVGKFRRIFVSWWVIWASLQVALLSWLGFALGVSILDSVASNLLLAATCILVSNTLQYYLPRQERYWYILVLSLVLSTLCIIISRVIIYSAYDLDSEYLLFFKRSLPIRFGLAFLLIACMAMISVVWYTIEEQKENEQRKHETEKQNREAELFKLRQQLQPHFLFNSLNSITALIGSQPEQARIMIHQLSDFLRGTLKKEEQQWVSLGEELQYIDLYLSIEKVRFGHRLTTHIEADEMSRGLKLPNMLLQPLVENAIKFGLYDTTEDITIHINAYAENHHLIVAVDNPFDPETSKAASGTGFGLNSISRRMQLLFSRNDLLFTTINQNLFTTTVKIPQEK